VPRASRFFRPVLISCPPRVGTDHLVFLDLYRTSRACRGGSATELTPLPLASPRLSGRADAVGMCISAGQAPAIDNWIFLADRAAVEPAFEDFAGPGGVARLRRQ
jgi:hypothetical protein